MEPVSYSIKDMLWAQAWLLVKNQVDPSVINTVDGRVRSYINYGIAWQARGHVDNQVRSDING